MISNDNPTEWLREAIVMNDEGNREFIVRTIEGDIQWDALENVSCLKPKEVEYGS